MAANSLLSGCNLCHSYKAELRCSACKIVRYCPKEHQAADWPNRKSTCNSIKRAMRKMDQEKQGLVNVPEWGNVLETHVGHFLGIHETRDFMRARMSAVVLMLNVDTRDSVEACLAHLLDTLRLCRSDNQGVRDYVPGLYLRLGRDQESYDFSKWWLNKSHESNYEWDNMDLPHLDLKDEDVLESPAIFKSDWHLAQTIGVALLKLRMLFDLRDWVSVSVLHEIDRLNYDTVRLIYEYFPKRSSIWSSRPGLLHQDLENSTNNIKLLEEQTDTLFEAVDTSNTWLWKGMLEYERYWNVMPESFSAGTQEQMVILTQQSAKAWVETHGAMEWIQRKTSG